MQINPYALYCSKAAELLELSSVAPVSERDRISTPTLERKEVENVATVVPSSGPSPQNISCGRRTPGADKIRSAGPNARAIEKLSCGYATSFGEWWVAVFKAGENSWRKMSTTADLLAIENGEASD